MSEQSRSAAARRRMAEAQERAARASTRIAELQDLLIRLEKGQDLTEADLGRATSALRESVDATRAARQHHRDERLHSAATHRSVAALFSRIGKVNEANRHIRAAEADELEAREVAD